MNELKITSVQKIHIAAREFLELTRGKKVFAFYGEMGSGKTTFIKAICRELGVQDLVSSPSFALVYEYIAPDDKRIFHFDLYRINDPSELFDIGYEDYFYSESLCFIEWPEKAEFLLPEDCLKVHITVSSDGSRVVRFEE